MWQVLILVSLLFVLQEAVPVVHQKRWMKEIQESLRKNVRQCPFKLSVHSANPQQRSIDHKHFEVEAILPSDEAFEQFQRMPLAWTKVSPEFPELAKMNNYGETYRNDTSIKGPYLPDHPTQNSSNCWDIFHAAALRPLALFDDYKPIKRAYYFASIRNAIIYPRGAVGVSCGRFVGADGCESRYDHARRCHQHCLASIPKNGSWTDMWGVPNITVLDLCTCGHSYKHEDTVFVATAHWDQNYHHFNADSLARLAHFIPYLRAHSNIKIHIYAMEEHGAREFNLNFAKTMRGRLMALLGIDPSRFIHGTVLAKSVIIPKSMFCAHAAVNPVEIRLLASQLLAGAYKYLDTHRHLIPVEFLDIFLQRRVHYLEEFPPHDLFASKLSPEFFRPPQAKVMVILQRRCPAIRCWQPTMVAQITGNLSEQFPEHRVYHMQGNMSAEHCIACEIFLHSVTDILVGEHGAGLTNIMFMPAGSMLVETVGHMDNRMFPFCGYYSALSGSLGIHHYIYAYNGRRDHAHIREYKANFTAMAVQAAWFYSNESRGG